MDDSRIPDEVKTINEFLTDLSASMALATCIASLIHAAKEFTEQTYGNISVYLANKIEAEVRSQKQGLTTLYA